MPDLGIATGELNIATGELIGLWLQLLATGTYPFTPCRVVRC